MLYNSLLLFLLLMVAFVSSLIVYENEMDENAYELLIRKYFMPNIQNAFRHRLGGRPKLRTLLDDTQSINTYNGVLNQVLYIQRHNSRRTIYSRIVQDFANDLKEIQNNGIIDDLSKQIPETLYENGPATAVYGVAAIIKDSGGVQLRYYYEEVDQHYMRVKCVNEGETRIFEYELLKITHECDGVQFKIHPDISDKIIRDGIGDEEFYICLNGAAYDKNFQEFFYDFDYKEMRRVLVKWIKFVEYNTNRRRLHVIATIATVGGILATCIMVVAVQVIEPPPKKGWFNFSRR